YNTDDFRLSVNYIAFYDLLEKSNCFLEMILENPDKDAGDRLLFWKLERPIADAGQWDFLCV
ncbi:MAG: aminopeptidase, partial [Clostridiales bacterium]|nr:aminopeptidase [Clostridiales bacterium]